MGKRLTISNRWKNWACVEPFWAYLCLFCFMFSMAGLGIHLGVLGGFWRTFGLYMLIAGDAGCLGITAYRKQWWWHTLFWYLTGGVIGWEIGSYFFGSQL